MQVPPEPKFILQPSLRLLPKPYLVQALALLALPRHELDRVVREELLANPLLEEVEGSGPWGSHRAPALPRGASSGEASREGLHRTPENTPARDPWDWRASVREQLLHLPGPLRRAACALLHHLDHRGYLATPLPEVARRLGLPLRLAWRALACLRSCEPAGIGARSAADCLALQVRRRLRHLREKPGSEAERAVWRLALRALRRCPDDLARGDVPRAAARLRCTPLELRQALRALATLSPYPVGEGSPWTAGRSPRR